MKPIRLFTAALLSATLLSPVAMAQNAIGGNGAAPGAASRGGQDGAVGTSAGANSATGAGGVDAGVNTRNGTVGANNSNVNVAGTAANTTNGANGRVEYLSNMPGVWQANRLEGLPVYGERNRKIGAIQSILIDRQGRVAAVAINTGGSIIGGGRTVAVPFGDLRWWSTNRPQAAASGSGVTTGAAGGANATANGGGANQHRPLSASLPGATVASLKNAPRFNLNPNAANER